MTRNCSEQLQHAAHCLYAAMTTSSRLSSGPVPIRMKAPRLGSTRPNASEWCDFARDDVTMINCEKGAGRVAPRREHQAAWL